MTLIRILFITLFFTSVSNISFSEEKVICNDIKKYTKRMACKMKNAKNIINTKLSTSKKGLGGILKKEKSE
jgi:hypothetical protein